MISVGITGTISSGKSSACKFIAYKRGPVFSADETVKKLYSKKKFRTLISKKLNLDKKKNFKKNLKEVLLKKKKNLIKLEKIIHPLVRREMLYFLKKNRKKKFLFLEIPLLIESRLQRFFDITIFIKSNKNLRKKRYKTKGGDPKVFEMLNKHQLKDTYKMKLCNFTVINNGSFSALKKNLLNIIHKHV
tara:strand:+ start:322 stop:888 length:567 start_codon:yes stop_codon:yes gene_type:complete